MNDRIHRIRAALAERLNTDDIAIRDDSHLHVGHAGAATGLGHFHVTIRSPEFSGVRSIQRHRLVYAALGELMQTDIHAVQIRALAPEE
ncbi:BolA family protein [Salinisphaera sp.]|uniref:BolA family protein n=1 Tax=Salinisphaera sp. TaxID=1914330 RepID=UPI002D770FB1|nr:BolA family protein [Salinisphaera sp.]HET7313618.1 BolA family protein [Salinisphaera sp.]